jgi:hypothetical protein
MVESSEERRGPWPLLVRLSIHPLGTVVVTGMGVGSARLHIVLKGPLLGVNSEFLYTSHKSVKKHI